MKKVLFIIFFLSFVSCKNQSSFPEWTNEEKDEVFKTCVDYATEERKFDNETANKYCYCSLDFLTENFKNKEDAQMNISPDFRLKYESCLD